MNDFIDFLTDMAANVEKNTGPSNQDFESQFERDAHLKTQGDMQTGGHFLSDEKLEDMVIAQGLGVFFAGNDTTSSTLSVVSYFLAQYPDLQDRVYKEIQVSIFFIKVAFKRLDYY